MLQWWLGSSPWNGMTGHPSGPPEWPLKGGWLSQPSKLIEAVDLLRGELAYLRHSKEPQDTGKAARTAARKRRR